MLTGRYATETGVWHNGLALNQTLPTLATELHKAGYSTNLIGKWHLAPEPRPRAAASASSSPSIAAASWISGRAPTRSNTPRIPTKAPSTTATARRSRYKDEYRVDFITDRAERFLRQKHDRPFFLFISQLEPHQQNDMGQPHRRSQGFRPTASRTRTFRPTCATFPATGSRSCPTTTAPARRSTPPSAAFAKSSTKRSSPTTPSSSSSATMAATS